MSAGEKRFDRLMQKARQTNRRRDHIEHEHGFAAVSDLGIFQRLRTAMLAIECGIKTEDWDCVAEAQAILEGVHDEVERLPDLFKQSKTEFTHNLLRELRTGRRE